MVEKFFGCLSGWITDWGPGLLIALIMLYGLYRLLLHLGKDVGMKIVGALEKPSSALHLQAEAMDRLTGSIKDYVNCDRSEHREMIILLKLISDRLNTLEERKKDDGSQKRTIPED